MSFHRWLAVAVAASLISLHLPPGNAGSSFAELMPDANYRACVTSTLGLTADAEPTSAQLDSITALSCTGRGIVNVTGTSTMPHLSKLFLDSNVISDLRPLSSSGEIFSLGLTNNRVTSISPLASLTKLSTVGLANNQLADISDLSRLPAYSAISGTRYGQKAIAPDAAAGVPAVVPTILGAKGNIVTPTAPAGATVSGTSVTYSAPGSYTWSFRDETDFYFNGTVTVTVSEAAATIPDDALRECVAAKLGLAAAAEPTPVQLAAATGSLACKNKGIVSLVGLNLMTGLTSVTLTGNEIADVSPLSTMVNMTLLDVAQNQITSLGGLGSLPKLATLRVNQSSVSTKARLASLSGVERLPSLTALTINYSDVSNLAPLAASTSLKSLYATNSAISDIAPLASAAALSTLDLSGNHVSDLSPLKGRSFASLKVVDQVLTAAGAVATVATAAPSVVRQDGSTQVAAPPGGISTDGGSVTYDAAGTYVWTFTNASGYLSATFSGSITQLVKDAPAPIVPVAVPDPGLRTCLATLVGQDADQPITAEQLAGMTRVSCIDLGIADLTGVEHLVNVTELILSTNAISDLEPLRMLTGLRTLMLPGNAISDPSPLASLSGLTTLSLSYNPITSIASLAPLTALTDLEVTQRFSHEGADLTSLDGVQAMTTLSRLVVNNSSLTDLGPVAGLTSLRRLFVSGNQITDVTPLSRLTGLVALGLSDNRISDVGPLAGLTGLESIDLGSNRISDLSGLSGGPSLGYMGLKARWQTVIAPSATAGDQVLLPTPKDHTGAPSSVTPPADVAVQGGSVVYPRAGQYVWTFSSTSDTGEFFSGTITVEVTARGAEPTSGPSAVTPSPSPSAAATSESPVTAGSSGVLAGTGGASVSVLVVGVMMCVAGVAILRRRTAR